MGPPWSKSCRTVFSISLRHKTSSCLPLAALEATRQVRQVVGLGRQEILSVPRAHGALAPLDFSQGAAPFTAAVGLALLDDAVAPQISRTVQISRAFAHHPFSS